MRVFGIMLYALGFGCALTGTLWLLSAGLDVLQIEPAITRHEVPRMYRARTNQALARPARPGTFRVAYLGDSMTIDYPPEKQLWRVLQRTIRQRTQGRMPIEVLDFGYPGTGVYDFYLLGDLVADARPNLVIIPFNLYNASSEWKLAFSRAESSGWLRPERVGQAMTLPLSWAGITADRVLTNVSIVQLGGFEWWVWLDEERTRVENARLWLEEQVAYLGAATRSPEAVQRTRRYFRRNAQRNMRGSRIRYNENGMRILVGTALDGLPRDHATLRMLAAAVHSFRAHGIPALVYVTPLNIEHIERLGLLAPERLARSVAGVEHAARKNGGYFLDLHDLLPDRFFRDQMGHLAYADGVDGTATVARELANSVIEIARSGVAGR